MNNDNSKNQNIYEKPNFELKHEENAQRRSLSPEPDRFYIEDLSSDQHKPKIVRL